MLRVGFAQAIAYRSEFLIWLLSTNMPIIMLFLWRAVAREAPIGRYGTDELSAYFLCTLVVRLLTGSWVIWEMNFEIRNGSLANRLLRPLHPFIWYAAENLAAFPFRLLICLPIAGGTLFGLGPSHFTSDPIQWAIFPFVLLGSWCITFSVMVTIGTLGLYWESSVALFHLWLGLFFILSGYTIPLELFPPWLLNPVRWLPFRFQLSFPVEVLLGLMSRRESLFLLSVQWLSVALLISAALLLWRRGLKHYAAYGG